MELYKYILDCFFLEQNKADDLCNPYNSYIVWEITNQATDPRYLTK